ncbi:hypothetical protein [Marinobacter alexandrii]|uniref:hypothetical protein n=1 Tax=Marinobacter alexandrii TaxID=2570351 RepID=UPI003264364F
MENAGSKVSIAFPIGDPNAPNRLEFEDIVMFASPSNVRFIPRAQTREGLNHCRNVALKMLRTLNHTPVSAFGINFQFQGEDGGSEAIWRKLGASELLEEKPDLGISLGSLSVNKQFVVGDQATLNHQVAAKTDGAATFDFNYHHTCDDVSSILDALQRELIDQYYETTKSFIRSYYDVELPE